MATPSALHHGERLNRGTPRQAKLTSSSSLGSEIATACAGQTCEPAACGAAFVRSLYVEAYQETKGEDLVKKTALVDDEVQG